MEAIDVSGAVQFVMKCMNFDGGFGRVPGSESHAGQVKGLLVISIFSLSQCVCVCVGVLLCWCFVFSWAAV